MVSSNTQSRRLLLALVLLVVALAGVVLNDRQFWFGSTPAVLDSDGSAPSATPAVVAGKKVASPTNSTPTPAPAVATKSGVPIKTHNAASASSQPQAVEAPAVTRTVLPPLDVEVVAGDKHSTIRPGSNATKVEIIRPGSEPLTAATKAAEREQLSADVSQPGVPQASYPLLAQHMNVQGSVVLQALIGADGVIQNIKVVNGPAILTSAAEQAVREWRFKPVLQNGQAVETQARITVNFNIKVADGSGKTTVAENEPARIQVLSR